MNIRIPLGRAHLLARNAIREAHRVGLPIKVLTPVGSLRRYAPDVGDISLLAVAAPEDHAALLDAFAGLRMVTTVIARSLSHIEVAVERGRLRLHVASVERAGSALVWHTGSRRHTEQLQQRARDRGLTFEDGRLTQPDGAVLPASTEDEVYRRLGLPYIPPELREGAGEVDAAGRNEIPRLVSDRHIRGDLHMHSTWSDGRNSIEEMARTARQLGYEYIAITDHSERSWASRKLAANQILAQREEVHEVRERVTGIEILHGIEVDIMHDGSLDFDDAQLGEFDIVLASLHDHGGHGGERLTERYLRAIRHPLVNVITHPANRSPGLSPGYELEFDRLFAAAAETGTAMEIDGAPGHLDMDGLLARKAVVAGVTVVIDSDCHRAEALGRQMRFGVGTARRGWVEPRHVLNTRDISSIRHFVAKKRARR